MHLVLVLLGSLGLGGTAELLGTVLPLLACRLGRKISDAWLSNPRRYERHVCMSDSIPGVLVGGGSNVRCCLLAFSILVAAPMRTRR
jgi:hypothetical protein